MKTTLRLIYLCRTAHMSWRTCVVVKQIQSNQKNVGPTGDWEKFSECGCPGALLWASLWSVKVPGSECKRFPPDETATRKAPPEAAAIRDSHIMPTHEHCTLNIFFSFLRFACLLLKVLCKIMVKYIVSSIQDSLLLNHCQFNRVLVISKRNYFKMISPREIHVIPSYLLTHWCE